ncbi:hypothetical protein BOTNAR_0028g00010 [Botryotinia narcissicola]|uniref:Uncharacterized protein n=1 Tax=Botryotinia narcissicola TaxID=278944 RepID=A0A4Z1J3A9_9HELO|nr:hypothetical protein BOTNAR_0028g00010 [Botryotinia narcissicola]
MPKNTRALGKQEVAHHQSENDQCSTLNCVIFYEKQILNSNTERKLLTKPKPKPKPKQQQGACQVQVPTSRTPKPDQTKESSRSKEEVPQTISSTAEESRMEWSDFPTIQS